MRSRNRIAIGIASGSAFFVASLIVASCTIFNGLTPPKADAGDAADADSGSDARAPVAFLSEAQAGHVCALLSACPELAEGVVASLAIPVNATPSNYSACVNWLAGPIDPARRGLMFQRDILGCMAVKSSCGAANSCLPVRRVDDAGAGVACPGTSCSSDGGLAACYEGTAFEATCDPPLFIGEPNQTATCRSFDAGTATCVFPRCETPSKVVNCKDDVLSICTILGSSSVNCALTGRACEEAPRVSCVRPGGGVICDDKQIAHDCDDNDTVVRSCQYGAQTVFDCRAIGLGCVKPPLGDPMCGVSNAACTPYDEGINVCDSNNRIQLCVGGVKRLFSCKDIGAICATKGTSAACTF